MFKATAFKTTAQSLRYWDESLLEKRLPAVKPHRYVTFDIDQGGLNNIRLVFEYVVAVAAITGRTLVLPPHSPWYLINHGPMPVEQQGGVTHISDLYDIPSLKKAIPVISTEEFIATAHRHLSIPNEFIDSQRRFASGNSDVLKAWDSWLLSNTQIPGWNPYNTVIAYPNIDKAQNGPHFDDAYLDSRTPVEFTPKMNASPVLHFPSNEEFRSLGPIATMLACEDDHLPKLTRRLFKHHVRYRDDLIELAETIITRLRTKIHNDYGIEQYNAIQIRRNDFQYKQTRIGVEAIAGNIKPLFDQPLPIYIASDEDREEVYAELAKHLNSPVILSWRDVLAVYQDPIPYAWIGPLEQLICVPARRFIGTDLSTFTSYIHRLRGYLPAHDTNVYYHSDAYTNSPPATDAQQYRGRDYLREHPLLWQSC